MQKIDEKTHAYSVSACREGESALTFLLQFKSIACAKKNSSYICERSNPIREGHRRGRPAVPLRLL